MTRRISGYDIAKRKTTAALKAELQSGYQSELQLHIAIVDLLKATAAPGVIWWHTPNGERRDKRTAAKLKAMGVRPGVSDLIISAPSGQMMFMEIKCGGGRCTDAQSDFFAAMRANGHSCAVVWSLDEAVAVLSAWGAIKGARVAA
jgi:hypothetical protein